jgi:broad specificity phosphatase PhoE
MLSMNEIYLIRHGEVEEKYHRVFAGRTDIGLSEVGKKQAAVTADFYAINQNYCLQQPYETGPPDG